MNLSNAYDLWRFKTEFKGCTKECLRCRYLDQGQNKEL